jgi:hypothetical protein
MRSKAEGGFSALVDGFSDFVDGFSAVIAALLRAKIRDRPLRSLFFPLAVGCAPPAQQAARFTF